MKKISIYLVLALLIACGTAIAQKKVTEGTIVYALSTTGDINEAIAVMLPSEMIMKIKGSMTRTDIDMAMGNKTVAIMDTKTKTGTVLLDLLGNKYALKTDNEEIKKEMDDLPEFEVIYKDEEKMIAGYKSKKAIIRNKKTKDEMEVYYTDEISAGNTNNDPKFKDLKGFLMEYENDMNGIKMKMVVKTVTPEKISDEVFIIPTGYKHVTKDELMKELKGAASE